MLFQILIWSKYLSKIFNSKSLFSSWMFIAPSPITHTLCAYPSLTTYLPTYLPTYGIRFDLIFLFLSHANSVCLTYT